MLKNITLGGKSTSEFCTGHLKLLAIEKQDLKLCKMDTLNKTMIISSVSYNNMDKMFIPEKLINVTIKIFRHIIFYFVKSSKKNLPLFSESSKKAKFSAKEP